MTCDGFKDGRAIINITSHGSDGIKGGDKRDESIARDSSVSGLDAGDVAEARGHADGSARIFADGKCSETRRHRRGGTSARAARNVIEIPRIARVEESRIFA